MIDSSLNRELGSDANDHESGVDSVLGPVVKLHRTYIKVGHNALGKEIAVYTRYETVDLPALVAAMMPDYGLDDDCRVIRSRIEFGDVLDQWGGSA